MVEFLSPKEESLITYPLTESAEVQKEKKKLSSFPLTNDPW